MCLPLRDPMPIKIDLHPCPWRVEGVPFLLNCERERNGVIPMIAKWTLILGLTAVGCGDNAATTDAAKEGAAASSEAQTKSKVAKFDPATLKGEALKIALVPSPAEMQKALANAGLTAQLADMVENRDISMDIENKDQIAVRTGVVLADLVLTVKTASKEDQLRRIARIKEGMKSLGAGDEVQTTLDELSGRIKNDAGSREDLLKEFDELAGILVPDLKYEAGEWVIPLIKAGSWLEGAHLVAGAIKEEGKYEEAAKLLRQPHVIDYFIEYVDREGSDKAPDAVIAKLKETLSTLKEVTGKAVIEEEDVNTIHSATAAVLTML